MSGLYGSDNEEFSTKVMADLKDFQRDMVDYVFDRLYADEDPARRFLVASETGLGKTLVARGVIARAIDHLRGKKVEQINILYICSNAEIARQNIKRLNVTGQNEVELATRITLLPTRIRNLRKYSTNFISFTPGTSFDLGNTMGKQDERVLLYYLLRESWSLGNRKAPLNVLQGKTGTHKFRNLVNAFAREGSIEPSLKKKFQDDLDRRVQNERDNGDTDIQATFQYLCRRFSRVGKKVSPQDRLDRRRFVGQLRGILATACVETLKPDLIILDEFQRFKHLLDGADAASELARGLFEWGNAKTLLLSATPYKMYTLGHEEDDDHYADFLRTLEFLEYGNEQEVSPRVTLADYRRALFRIGEDGVGRADKAKSKLEDRLRRTMSRTEKLAATSDRNGMLVEIPSGSARLEARDLEGYVATRRVLDASGVGDAMEYWKSSPYLFNFMDGYSLKNKVAGALESGDEEVVRAFFDGQDHMLSRSEISAYREIDPSNARLRSLISDTVGAGQWKMLWIPPSMLYYRLGGAFSGSQASRTTKRLVFSSWRVVPKVISAMVSYEAERKMMSAFNPDVRNTQEARKRRRGLLRFTIDRTLEGAERPSGMPALGILYPSETLARECDPLPSGSESDENLPSVEKTLARIQGRVDELLEPVVAEHAMPSETPDEAWYWAAPILLDLHYCQDRTRAWFSQDRLPGIWSDDSDHQEEREDSSGFGRHVEQSRHLISGEMQLGTPPEDLSYVVALQSLAAPGVVALRALGRIAQGAEPNVLRNSAAGISWHLRTLFNLPESVSLIRSLSDKGKPYWQGVLAYSADGCLQSVLDEYAHVLKDFRGTPNETARSVAREMRKALGLKASSISVDHFEADEESWEVERIRENMRGRFALRFGDEKADDGNEATRSSQVREAFNSPFWPFVLATTSVGQEGLDFHTYCHAVVHWNLPSNPVDLEQREGRVHRYKNHAVRKNVAAEYGVVSVAKGDYDPWDSLFGTATRKRGEGATDMVPYWIFSSQNGSKIERHVPSLPLSRDRARMEVLRKSLAAYRMVFGQARQEDLLSYLLSRFTSEEVARYADTLRIDLQPPRNSTAQR